MSNLADALPTADSGFPDRDIGDPVQPCPLEGGIGSSINRALAKARRWITGHFTQQQGNSCVIASSRNMIHELTGQNIPEEQLRQEMRDIIGDPSHDFEAQGVNPAYAEQLLQKHGVKTDSKYNVASTDLSTTMAGRPALVGFKNPGHRVMLESVSTDSGGNRTYHVRDPDPAYDGKTRKMSQSEFDAKYNPNAIVISGEPSS